MEYEDPNDYLDDDPYGTNTPPPAAAPPPQAPVNGTDQAWRNPDGGRQYWDIDYWTRKGFGPDQIFGPDGQLRNGWIRTIYGYDRTAQRGPTADWDTNPTGGGDGPAPTTGGGGDTGGGGGVSYGGGAPSLNFDPYESAGPFQPRDDTFEFTPFSYDPYTASSWEDAEKEPGYDASRKQLKNQIEGGAAYRGMLRSGMTLKDIYTGLDSLGQQNFANFDNRRFRNYSANRDGAFQAWSGNLGAAAQKFALELGVDKDIYDRKATDVDRGNNYRFNAAQATAQDALARWQEQVRSLTQISTAGMNS